MEARTITVSHPSGAAWKMDMFQTGDASISATLRDGEGAVVFQKDYEEKDLLTTFKKVLGDAWYAMEARFGKFERLN